MATPATREETTRLAGARPDTAAVAHLLVSTLFLALAGALTLLAFAALAFPDNFSGMLSYGRLRPMALTATILGWLVPALAGAIYYVLPRLTGTLLWRENLAHAGLWGVAALTLAGIVSVGFGMGDGVEPLGLPWWLDLPVLAVLAIPALITVQTVRSRSEKGAYITLWFVMAGAVWLPLLYVVGNLQGLGAVGRELGAVEFTAGFLVLWVVTVGAGIAFYTVVKLTDNPLTGRPLAQSGFWSLAFASVWMGASQLALGPTPDWLDAVAAVLTLAFPVGVIACTAAVFLTVGDGWEQVRERPTLNATTSGLWMAVAISVAAALAAFRSPAALVGMTAFWDGILYAGLFGVGGLLVAGWIYQALPPLTGRKIISPELARRHVNLTVAGVGGTALLLGIAGVLQGVAWTGGSFTGAFIDAGPGWQESAGLPGIFIGLSLVTVAIAFAGQLAFALNVYRTVTSGRVTTQEVFVSRQTEETP